MTKVHHTKYKPRYKQYILDQITDDGWDNPLTDRREKIAHIIDRFHNEYGHEIPRQGKPKALAEWLSGMALPIATYNSEIIDLAIEMGSIDENPSDNLIDRVLDNYYPFMANMTQTETRGKDILEMECEL